MLDDRRKVVEFLSEMNMKTGKCMNQMQNVSRQKANQEKLITTNLQM